MTLWFVCFEFPPANGFGVFERKGKSTIADSREDAIQQIAIDFKRQGIDVSRYPVDAYQYRENDE